MEVCGAAFESLSEMEPRPSTTGAQIDNRGGRRGIKSALKQRGGGSVRLRDIETVLKRVHDVISKECWKPRLFVEFDELYAMHINPPGEETARRLTAVDFLDSPSAVGHNDIPPPNRRRIASIPFGT